jgi:hypothetical protein
MALLAFEDQRLESETENGNLNFSQSIVNIDHQRPHIILLLGSAGTTPSHLAAELAIIEWLHAERAGPLGEPASKIPVFPNI